MTYDMIIVDGMNTIWRAAHAMKALGYEDRNGFVETGAVYGFFDMTLSVVNRSKHADVIVAWEGSRKGRREIDPEYKAHRDEPDEAALERMESVFNQRDVLSGLLKLTKWGEVVAPGWEADDAIATTAAAASRAGLDVLILSNDGDLFQCLVDEPGCGVVHQWKTSKSENDPVWTPNRLVETYGVTPPQWAHVKALGGDSSDGYKGAPGIGEKWACKLIAQHESVDAILRIAKSDGLVDLAGHKSPVLTASKAAAIVGSEAYVRTCLDLATTRAEVRTRLKWGEGDREKLERAFAGLRFHSLASSNTIRRLTK